jgi:hypothetical protein
MEPDGDSTTSSPALASLVARLVRLPVAAFVFGMEMFVLTLQGLQRFTDEGIEAMAGGAASARARQRAPSAAGGVRSEPAAALGPQAVEPGTTDGQPTTNLQKEPVAMPDTNLSDDMLKLVRYKVLFIKRDYEVAFPEQEELVHDNMTETAFTAWKVAEFIQRLAQTEIPPKWARKEYPRTQGEKDAPKEIRDKWEAEKGTKTPLVYWLPEGDKKFLRVYFEVLSRYARERFRHDEREVEVLEEIRDAIRRRDDGAGTSTGSTVTTSGVTGSGKGSVARP